MPRKRKKSPRKTVDHNAPVKRGKRGVGRATPRRRKKFPLRDKRGRFVKAKKPRRRKSLVRKKPAKSVKPSRGRRSKKTRRPTKPAKRAASTAFARNSKYLSGASRSAQDRGRKLKPGSNLLYSKTVPNPHGGYWLERVVVLLFEKPLLTPVAMDRYRPWASHHVDLFHAWVFRKTGLDTPTKLSTKTFYSIGSTHRQRYTTRESYGWDAPKVADEQAQEVEDTSLRYQAWSRDKQQPLKLGPELNKIFGFEIRLTTITLGLEA